MASFNSRSRQRRAQRLEIAVEVLVDAHLEDEVAVGVDDKATGIDQNFASAGDDEIGGHSRSGCERSLGAAVTRRR